MKGFIGHIRGSWKSVCATILIFATIGSTGLLLKHSFNHDDLLPDIATSLAFGLFISLLWSWGQYYETRDLKKKLGAIDLSTIGEEMVLTDRYDGAARVIEINGVYKNTKVRITHRVNDNNKQEYLDFYVESHPGTYEKATEVKVYHRINREILLAGLRNAMVVVKERKRLR